MIAQINKVNKISNYQYTNAEVQGPSRPLVQVGGTLVLLTCSIYQYLKLTHSSRIPDYFCDYLHNYHNHHNPHPRHIYQLKRVRSAIVNQTVASTLGWPAEQPQRRRDWGVMRIQYLLVRATQRRRFGVEIKVGR